MISDEQIKALVVPDKKHGPLDDEAVGYNNAIDDMLSGGE